jgi:hypothetical protein
MASTEGLGQLPDSDTDPATARMCHETGHVCPACPSDVRNLGAVAHNAAGAVRAALEGHGGWDRARRKLAELERVLEQWRPTVDAHFEVLETWRRP